MFLCEAVEEQRLGNSIPPAIESHGWYTESPVAQYRRFDLAISQNVLFAVEALRERTTAVEVLRDRHAY